MPRKSLVWIGLGGTALLLQAGLRYLPQVAERFYSRGLFVGIRWAWDYTFGLSPIPLIYIAVPVLLGWMIGKLTHRFRQRRIHGPGRRWKPSPGRRLGRGLLSFIGGLGALVFLFYGLWGFNYRRPSLESTIGLEVQPLGRRQILAESAAVVRELTEARFSVEGAGPEPLGSEMFPANLEGHLRESLSRVIRALGYPAPGRPRVRRFHPGSLPMRFFISGIFIPFLEEGYVAAGMTPPEMPFAMAHEMAHGYGFTEEGTANFLAWLACEASSNAAVRYSGRLAYWGYVSGELRRASPAEHRTFIERLPDGVKADLRAAFRNWNRFRGRLTRIGREVNDRYLKSQGVREGVLSYNRMVVLARAWRMSGRLLPEALPKPAGRRR